MRNPTRKLFDSYVARQAQLNGVSRRRCGTVQR
jgi:hypothetical protein